MRPSPSRALPAPNQGEIEILILKRNHHAMGPDLADKRWIVAKGVLFACLAILAGGLQLVLEDNIWQESALLLICIWASCRFYYFLFYCLQTYVDPSLKSAGVLDLVSKILARRRSR